MNELFLQISFFGLMVFTLFVGIFDENPYRGRRNIVATILFTIAVLYLS